MQRKPKIIPLVTNVANLRILHTGVRKEKLRMGTGVALAAENHTVTENAVAKQRLRLDKVNQALEFADDSHDAG